MHRSSVVASISDWIAHPQSAAETLGSVLPEKAPFFVSYILLNGFAKYPIYLCRASSLALYGLQSLTARTARLRRQLRDPIRNQCDYSIFVPNMLLMLVLTLTYAVIQPIVILASFLTFATGWIVYRYLLLYVYSPLFESGGLLWPVIFDYAVVGLVISQLTVIGVFTVCIHSASFSYIPLCLISLKRTVTFMCSSRRHPRFKSCCYCVCHASRTW